MEPPSPPSELVYLYARNQAAVRALTTLWQAVYENDQVSLQAVATRAHVGSMTVKRVVDRLVQLRVLEVEDGGPLPGGGRAPRRYRFRWPPP